MARTDSVARDAHRQHPREPPARLPVGHIQGIWRDLGTRCGHAHGFGLRRIEVTPGHFSTPAHEHGADEEIFFVLAGEGLLWQEGKTYAIARGDCIVHRPRRGAHTFRAGETGLDVLVFGERRDASLTALPRAGVAWSFPRWVELGDGDSPFVREAAAGAPECPPPTRASRDTWSRWPTSRRFSTAARAGSAVPRERRDGPQPRRARHGQAGAPAHCHSAEEELFVVLEGEGVLELWRRGGGSPRSTRCEPATSSRDRPAQASRMRCAPARAGITYLAYGTRDPNDMCFYPQSGRVSLRGLGIALRSPEIEHLPEL